MIITKQTTSKKPPKTPQFRREVFWVGGNVEAGQFFGKGFDGSRHPVFSPREEMGDISRGGSLLSAVSLQTPPPLTLSVADGHYVWQ